MVGGDEVVGESEGFGVELAVAFGFCLSVAGGAGALCHVVSFVCGCAPPSMAVNGGATGCYGLGVGG